MLSGESNTIPGGVVIDDLFVTTVDGRIFDMKNFIAETVIHEDIFSNTLTGYCLVLDAAALLSKIPFMGNEYLTAIFRTPNFTETIGRTFAITGLTERKFVSTDREVSYVLQFMSVEGVKDNVKRIHSKYSGSADSVVWDIHRQHLLTPRYMGTNDATPLVALPSSAPAVAFVAAYWQPFRAINFVANRARNTDTSAPNYLYFESNKSFYFGSVEELMDRQIKSGQIFAEYTYSHGADIISDPASHRFTYTKPEIVRKYGVVEKMKAFDTFDTLKQQDYGHFASTLVMFDVLSKRYSEHTYDHWTNFSQFKHLHENPTFPGTAFRHPDTMKSVRVHQPLVHNNLPDQKYSQWVQARHSLLYDLSNIRLQITVPGRTDIEVGNVINYIMPQGIDKNEGSMYESVLDPYYSGLYLITAIKHNFSSDTHSMVLEITKDSLKTALR